MWFIIVYDLPMADREEQKNYRELLKFLQRSGFSRQQKSVFCRWVDTVAEAAAFRLRLRKSVPEFGDLLLLEIPETAMNRSENYRDGIRQPPPRPPDPWMIL